jgi:toxin HigB-1
MIKSFKCKETEKLFNQIRSRKFSSEITRVARRKLEIMEAATTLADLRVPPSNHLEKLKRDREGQHSIRINLQWRICFVWDNGDAFDVEIVDYH